jgi:hypothetical protein
MGKYFPIQISEGQDFADPLRKFALVAAADVESCGKQSVHAQFLLMFCLMVQV